MHINNSKRYLSVITLGIVSLISVGVVKAFPAAAVAAKSSGCVVKPAGDIITPAMASTINQLEPLYQEAAQHEGVSWLLVPPLHFREHDLQMTNPTNAQGIFQLYSSGLKFTPGAQVSDADFVHQAVLALQALKGKAVDGLITDNGVAQAYFGYNGQSPLYYEQARERGFPFPLSFEGSPYVYNLYSSEFTGLRLAESRWDPVYRRWISYLGPVDTRPGAFTIYSQLEKQCSWAPVPPPPDLINAPHQAVAPPAVTLSIRQPPEAAPKTATPTVTSSVKSPKGAAVPGPHKSHSKAPIYAFAGFLLALVLMWSAWQGIVVRNPAVLFAWVVALVLAVILIHHDGTVFSKWRFNPRLSARVAGERGAMALLGLTLLAGTVACWKWHDRGRGRIDNRMKPAYNFRLFEQSRNKRRETLGNIKTKGDLGEKIVDLILSGSLWSGAWALAILYKTLVVVVDIAIYAVYALMWVLRKCLEYFKEIVAAAVVVGSMFFIYQAIRHTSLGVGASFKPTAAILLVVVGLGLTQLKRAERGQGSRKEAESS